ncbi:MAG TPA: hypothetical protein VF719_00355, partial [Abditibacteriaceae bacterium]
MSVYSPYLKFGCTSPRAFATNSLALVGVLALGGPALHAQEGAPLASTYERGRMQLEADDAAAVDTLRLAAQESLQVLTQARNMATSVASSQPGLREQVQRARERAAQSHYYWGIAADRYARADEAITALSRAVSLANELAGSSRPGSKKPQIARDSTSALNNALRNGLPYYSADDTLDIVARDAHGGLWKPRRVQFNLPESVVRGPAVGDVPKPGAAAPVVPFDLLVTSGKLFPPEQRFDVPGVSRLSRIPPLYAAVAPNALPASLKMDRMIVGYERETSGANRGLWRQSVRVFYASSYLTKENRDDRPRAEALCEQFLKVAATTRAALGMQNSYTPGGVTTLWLSEVSSWWPDDDDDPIIAAQMPSRMPPPNTPTTPKGPITTEVQSTPLTLPWRASAQLDSAPGEIMYFKMTQPRREAEWLRQTMHEYGHVALPAFNGFAPPLEPYGNGALAETLQMLWVAQNPAQWALKDVARVDAKSTVVTPVVSRSVDIEYLAFSADADKHASLNALPAFVSWKKDGPQSTLRRAGTREGLQYLSGLALYIERVYGAPTLGAAFRALPPATLNKAPRL